jgi:hypothetical protein
MESGRNCRRCLGALDFAKLCEGIRGNRVLRCRNMFVQVNKCIGRVFDIAPASSTTRAFSLLLYVSQGREDGKASIIVQFIEVNSPDKETGEPENFVLAFLFRNASELQIHQFSIASPVAKTALPMLGSHRVVEEDVQRSALSYFS